jgi:phosphoglycolate phosphatase-like HAD superfamily hydrolase
VGDSKLDQIAAKLADIPFVAYKNRALAADYHIESLQEIEKILSL